MIKGDVKEHFPDGLNTASVQTLNKKPTWFWNWGHPLVSDSLDVSCKQLSLKNYL